MHICACVITVTCLVTFIDYLIQKSHMPICCTLMTQASAQAAFGVMIPEQGRDSSTAWHAPQFFCSGKFLHQLLYLLRDT